MKTVRFTQVVQRSGKPRVHTLWVEPEKDPEFSRAREANRVMTVQKSGTGKADVGIIGFDAKHAHEGQFLVFPKSLKPFAEARVIGIKFDLVDQPDLVAAPAVLVAPPSRKRPRVTTTPLRQPAGEVIPWQQTRPNKKAKPAGAQRADESPRSPPPPLEHGQDATEEARPEELPSSTRAQRGRPPTARRGVPARKRKTGPAASKTTEQTLPVEPKPDADPKLLREVKLAMKELEAGKAVAAYQRLERAVAAAEK